MAWRDRLRWLGLSLLGATSFAQSAAAEEPRASASVSTTPLTPQQTETRAKELFERGNRLRAAGDCQRAIGFFLASRELLAAVPNTLNAAYCHYELGQLDEALLLYEALLLDHDELLDEGLRAKLERRIAAIVPKVARLSVQLNRSATLVVDGRSRGELPSARSLVLMPGKHEVRVVKTGFEQATRQVELKAGQTRTLAMQLRPLTQRGVLRIALRNHPGGSGAVWLDGARVGDLPFEAALAPGNHWLAVEVGDRGSGPQQVVIVDGQVSLVEPELQPLGRGVRLSVQPAEAQLVLDGTPLLGSTFAGRLPLGKHRIKASAPGYVSRERVLQVEPGDGQLLALDLDVDPDHPRWRREEASSVRVGARVRGMFGAGLGSGPEASADDTGGARGAWIGAQLDYQLPSGLLPFASLGYGWLSTQSSRRIDQDVGSANELSYQLEDEAELRGPWVAAGLGYSWQLADWDLVAALSAGVIFAGIDLTTSGSAVRGAETAPIRVEGSDRTRAAIAFLMPEIEIAYRIGRLRVGLGLGALVSPIGGPDNGRGDVGPIPDGNVDCARVPTPVACARSSSATREELSVGRFVLVSPSVGISWIF